MQDVALDAIAPGFFGREVGSTAGWYRATVAAGLPPGGRALFVPVPASGEPACIFPMLQTGTALASLSTPYTILWRPLLAPGVSAAQIEEAGAGLGALCKGFGTVRLDAMDAEAPWMAPLAEGLRRGGLRIQPFDHFGNWQADLQGLDWAGYLAARPGALRGRRSAGAVRS